jgi:hypothetical protein
VLSGVGNCTRSSLQISQLVSVLECWHSGPNAVEGKLAEMNVRAETARLNKDPGELVERTYHQYFDNSLNCVFAWNELVAVERFESALAGDHCVFAQFCGEAPGDEQQDGDEPGGVQQPGLLRRRYSLWCGDMDEDSKLLTTHTHLVS